MKQKLNSEILNYYSLFWIFVTAGFLGVFLENIWCIYTTQTFEYRNGVIFGPFNPVYGFGAIFMTIILYQIQEKKDLFIFLCSALSGAVFEYVCSLFQELVFGTISWDYSDTLLNLNGRTNLMFSVFWGVLGVAWLKILLPRISSSIKDVPKKLLILLTLIGTIFMAFNICISYLAIERQMDRRRGVEAKDVVSQFLDRNYSDEILKRLYPNMKKK